MYYWFGWEPDLNITHWSYMAYNLYVTVTAVLGEGGLWVGDWPLLPDSWQAMYVEADVPVPGRGAMIGMDSPITLVPPWPDR